MPGRSRVFHVGGRLATEREGEQLTSVVDYVWRSPEGGMSVNTLGEENIDKPKLKGGRGKE